MAEDKRREPEGPAITPTQPSMPESRPTTQLPAVPDWAIELTRSVKAGFAASEARFDKQDVTLERVSNESIETNVRLDRVETRLLSAEGRVDLLESRAGKTSLAVKGASQVDVEQAAQLAQERSAREALAKQVAELTTMQETQLAILGRLDKVASNPMVKTVMTILGTALATWAASKGLK